MIKDQATRNLNNFLSSYTLQESTELLNQVYGQVTEAINAPQRNLRKENILDFLEALEELLPAVYELHKWNILKSRFSQKLNRD